MLQPDEEKRKQLKKPLFFVLGSLIFVGLLVLLHHERDPSPVGEKYFAQRLPPEKQAEYEKAKMTDKQKAQRNIFLQNP
jgi:hypothetical protein